MAERRTAGFTLMEMLVVLVIVSLLVLALPQLTPSVRQGFQSRAAAFDLAAALRGARAEAVSGNQETRLVLGQNNYRIDPGGSVHTLRDGLSLSAEGVSTLGEQLIIRFFPDGSSSGGRVTLAGNGGQSHHVTVQALSGRISVDE